MGFFSSYREIRRLRKALDKAERKLEDVEGKRERERDAQYRLHLAMLDRYHTSQLKAHAVSMGVAEALVPEVVSKPDPLAGWLPEEREYDIRCFREAGHPNPEQAAEEAYIQNYVMVNQR